MKMYPSLLLAATLSISGVHPIQAQTAGPAETNDGREVWDKDGLVFRTSRSQVATYNRELLNLQRRMNQNRPPDAPLIPETGRYNREMFEHGYLRLKGEQVELVKGARVDRMVAIADLLDKRFSDDSFNDKGLEEDLIRAAKAKSAGGAASVFDVVEAKLAQRRAYLERAKAEVLRYETGMRGLKGANPVTDPQADAMALDEASARRWLGLAGLETQAYHVRNLRERTSPESSDAQLVAKLIDKSSPDQRARYRELSRRIRTRCEDLGRVLETARNSLQSAEPPDAARAALASSRKELGGLSVDYGRMLDALAGQK